MLGRFIQSANRTIVTKRAANFSCWGAVTAAPPDPILGLNDAFKKETNPKKVLLGMGAYRDDNNKPVILKCVRKAEHLILERDMDHEYAGITGIESYVQKCLKLGYGAQNRAFNENRIAGSQSISGTGSLRLGYMFLAQWYPHKDIDFLIPNPTWPIHRTIADLVGYKWKDYRYYHAATKGLDFEGMKEDLKNAKDHSAVMFHVCAHNPTGVDPSPKQWEEILEIVKRKKLFSLFDSAYQGFASGDLEKDSFAIKLFAEHTDDIMLFQSFAKNFGLYGQRAGCFSVVTASPDEKEIVLSRIKAIARPIYSNPPIHGARIVDIILGDPELTKMWHQDLKDMSGRMQQMRKGLRSSLEQLGNEHDWSHVTNQIGMFAYTGLNKDMVNELREKYAIYMTMDGRISIAGLNTKNLAYVSEAFHKVTHGKKF